MFQAESPAKPVVQMPYTEAEGNRRIAQVHRGPCAGGVGAYNGVALLDRVTAKRSESSDRQPPFPINISWNQICSRAAGADTAQCTDHAAACKSQRCQGARPRMLRQCHCSYTRMHAVLAADQMGQVLVQRGRITNPARRRGATTPRAQGGFQSRLDGRLSVPPRRQMWAKSTYRKRESPLTT